MRRLITTLIAALVLTAGCSGNSQLAPAGSTGSGSGSGTGTGTGTGTGSVPAIASITATTSSPTILSDGSTTATISALVLDSNNNLVAGVPVVFGASSGGVAVTQASTGTNGAATATLSTAGNGTLRTITVTTTASGKSSTVTVQVVSGASTTTVQMGSPAGAGFVASTIGISSTKLSAGGSASLTVALQQSDGTLYTQPATINFNSTCVAGGQASITSASSPQPGTATTTTGIATATYVAKGCSGPDTITATTTVGTNALSATGTITVAPATVGSIVFKSASPIIIALKGSGTTAAPQTSTVVFQVLDNSGAPSAGASVTFSLNTSVGGVSVAAGPVTSDANGNVQTTVNAGTVATPVRVTATVVSTSISTQSNQLSVSTGIPTQAAFSLAVQTHNIEALDVDGVQVAVTARLADRFSNPVPDGTAVQFNAEGGHIGPQCTTITTATESGVCTVNWISANPRPTIGKGGRAGRSAILAYAIGEESFVDNKGDGMFDVGDTWTDLGERFRDDYEDGAYHLGEFFYDFNNNGVRDGPDGLFNGVLCNDPAHCQAGKESTGIGIGNEIIMCGSTPDNLAPTSGTVLPGASIATGVQTYVFNVADKNGNPMAAGTVVSASVSGTGVQIAPGSPASYTYPDTTEPLSYAFTVAIGSTAAAGSNGSLILTIKSAGGVTTTATYTFPIVP